MTQKQPCPEALSLPGRVYSSSTDVTVAFR